MSEPAAAVLPAAPDADARLGTRLGERISDRLNPILVREIQQAMSGKTFLGVLMLALVGVVLVALTAAVSGGRRQDGWDAFVLAMRVLAPILLLVVPLQAFLSMRQEVAAGTIEHLLLSRLKPGAVVRGKVYAAGILSLVFFSVFAPLIALSYLLRGVDVPTIALALVFAFLYAIGAAALGIAFGSLSRWPAFRVLPLLGAALVLTLGAILVTSAMEYFLWGLGRETRGDGSFWLVAGTYALPVAIGVPLFAMTASAALAHPYENRSTSFRAFATALLAVVLVWVGWAAYEAATRFGGLVTEGGARVAEAAGLHALLLAPFWMFAATEPDRLSPRVRTLVPRSALLAALSVPFLPGGARGVLFTVLLAGAALGLSAAVPAWFGLGGGSGATGPALLAWSYAVLFASLARVLRRLLRRPALSRLAFPLLAGLLLLVPALVDVTVGAADRGWWSLHVLNPFATVDHVAGTSGSGEAVSIVAFVLLAAVGALLAQGRALVEGVREVLGASAARRRRAS